MRITISASDFDNISNEGATIQPEGPLKNFLNNIAGENCGDYNYAEHPHYKRAESVQKILGGNLNDYLKKDDRDLKTLLIKAKQMKINDFRNRIDQAFEHREKGGEICKELIQNLVSEFGKFELLNEPFNFSIYNNEVGNLVYERRGKEEIINEINAKSTLEMIHTFRDDIKLVENYD